MILPMKKVALFVLDSEKTAALKTLRSFGAIHIERTTVSSEHLSELQSLQAKLLQAETFIIDAKDKKAKPAAIPTANRETLLAVVDDVLTLKAKQADTNALIAKLTADIELYEAWGEFDPADLQFCAQKGLHLIPGEISERSYAALPDTVKTVRLASDKKGVRFVIITEQAELPEGIPADFRALPIPEQSLSAMKEERKQLTVQLPAYQRQIAEKASYLAALKAELKKLAKEIEFESIRAGMAVVPLHEEQRAPAAALAHLSGYVLAEKMQDFTVLAKANGWAFIADDPTEEDAVPTALRHNKFVRLLTPLTDFLGTVPGYFEPDISLWFLLFCGIFFAMIFGDAGYGALLVIISVVGIVKSKSAGKGVPLAYQLFLYLGLLTVIWGTAVCNWFGLSMDYVPQVLQDISIPAISNITEEKVRNANLMQFCFTLGLLQLSIGHIIGIVRNIRSPQILGHIGSISMLCGMYVVVLSLVVNGEKYHITQPIMILVAVGFVLNFVFSNYQTGIGQSIVESLKNIINMLLGVVNVFADIMSYIRLWAVGLAGSAISATVNQMAGPLLGNFLIFLGVLLLFFGHGLNYILNVLSVIVHGVRLNTLEFSNHVGLTWAGFKYEPFTE